MVKASIKAGKGKLRGRHCVVTTGNKKAKGFKGKGSTYRFYGCFKSKADAQKRAKKLSR